MPSYCGLDARDQVSVKFDQNDIILVEEVSFESIIVKMTTILFQFQCFVFTLPYNRLFLF